ncbi:MAG: hypothetical protein HOB37_18255 [Rhodospirillaceae bacterium]|jgi:hypothetical protein|nr:hypothetical protein [Rhodospirillaceae bacterium]MBT6610382.1 hypothetical protein [Rhodospirillaceae bacterium]
MTAFAEIPVADAEPDILDIYQRLMSAAGSGSPALIFRHLAVTPGLLNWVWRAIGADAEAGWVRDAVWRIVAEMAPVAIDPITPAVLSDTGIDRDARRQTGDMLTSYNRMNPVNLILMGAVRVLISGAEPTASVGAYVMEPSSPPIAPPDLPPPPAVASLNPDLQAAIRALCVTIPDVGAEVTPTLYRHFAIWPRFMMTVAERLNPSLDALNEATLSLNDACAPLIEQVAERARERVSEPPPITNQVILLRVLDGFSYVIPHLVVVGQAIEAALPGEMPE